MAKAALKCLAKDLQVQIVGDSEVMINCLLGRASAKDPQILKSIQVAQTALKTLVECFQIKPPHPEELAKQTPRADNSAADAAASWALDHGSFNDVRAASLEDFLRSLSAGEQSLGILFAFDGAARGNPGPSSAGICAWWGHFHSGAFQADGLLLQRGACLGAGTNNSAESKAMAIAMKTTLLYYFWVIDCLTELAQRS